MIKDKTSRKMLEISSRCKNNFGAGICGHGNTLSQVQGISQTKSLWNISRPKTQEAEMKILTFLVDHKVSFR